MAVSKSQEAKEINIQFIILKAKLLSCQSKLEVRGEEITAEAVKHESVHKHLERIFIIRF